jgi:lysozyme
LVWTDDQIEAAYNQDVTHALAVCNTLPWFSMLDTSHAFVDTNPRQCVLVGMAFQMGSSRLMGFHKALAAIRDEHWADAAAQMLDSDWARETPGRARRMARQMETGQWQ